jgi:hypothetical protein
MRQTEYSQFIRLAAYFPEMQLARDSKQVGNIIRRVRKKQGLNQT